jgi:hypothetical protein
MPPYSASLRHQSGSDSPLLQKDFVPYLFCGPSMENHYKGYLVDEIIELRRQDLGPMNPSSKSDFVNSLSERK